MTLNGVMAVILRYFSEFGSFQGALSKSSRSLSHLLVSSCVMQQATPQYKNTFAILDKLFFTIRAKDTVEHRYRGLSSNGKLSFGSLVTRRVTG